MCYCPALETGETANPFVAAVFNDCVYTRHGLVSVIFGWISIACWFIASYPQIRLSLMLKRAESISTPLLLLWNSGDISNLASLILLREPLAQIIMGGLWVLMDGSLTAVTMHYKIKHRDKTLPPIDPKVLGRVRVPELVICMTLLLAILSSFLCYSVPVSLYMQRLPEMFPKCKDAEELSHTSARYIVGSVLAYVTLPLYCFSSVTQVVKNCKTKNTDDLSGGFFATIAAANAAQATSLLTYSIENEYLIRTTPYIIAAVFPMSMDFTILIQKLWYSNKHRDRHSAVKDSTEASALIDQVSCSSSSSTTVVDSVNVDGLVE